MKGDEVVQRDAQVQKLDVPSHLRSGESDHEDEAPAPQRELTPEEMAMAASAAALDVPSADVSYSSGGGSAASAPAPQNLRRLPCLNRSQTLLANQHKRPTERTQRTGRTRDGIHLLESSTLY